MNNRVNKGQANFDWLDLASLTTLQTNLLNAINTRLAGNGTGTTVTTEIDMGAFTLKCETISDLREALADVGNAIQKKQPGSTFTTVCFE